jgi:hypothetical protein
MLKIEALADAIASLNDWTNPSGDAYRLRNPGLLRAFTQRHADEGGRRIFPSLVDGYQALVYDLKKKCAGESRSKLQRDSTIKQLLMRGYGQAPASEEYVLCFLESAIPNTTFSATAPIEFFLEA